MDFPTIGTAVDCSCSGNPGKVEYRGVDLETGEILFEMSFDYGTNNLGEFLAVVSALKRENCKRPIYTDSITALSWLRKKQTKSTMTDKEAEPILTAARQAVLWLRKNNVTGDVLHWRKEWGEIIADYGRK